MTMAPHTDDTEVIRAVFREMKELRDKSQTKTYRMRRVLNCRWACRMII